MRNQNEIFKVINKNFPRIICHGLHNLCDAGVLVYNQEHRDRRDALLLRAKLISEMQSDALSDPYGITTKKGHLAVLNGILKDPDILQATVYDDANDVFAQISGRNFDSSAKLDLKT